MAAIDKLYVNSYFEYDDLRRWAIAYYPQLLFYFYDITITYQEWENNCRNYTSQQLKIAKRYYQKIKDANGNKEEAIKLLIKHYKETANYDCSVEQAEDEVEYIFTAYNRIAEDWEQLYRQPIINTPFSVDKKLLWICPISFVRKYLEQNCGYKTKWYHKLFWRGKKHF